MTRDSAKNIGLKAALRMHSREPKYFDGHIGLDARIDEIIRILDEIEQIHPSTIAALQRRKQRPWLKASIIAVVLAVLIVAMAWWFL